MSTSSTSTFAAAPVVVRRYADAVFQLAVEDKALDTLASPLAALKQIIADHDLRDLLEDPRLLPRRRAELAQAIAAAVKAPPLLEKTLLVLARNNRLALIPALAHRLITLQDKLAGITHVRLETAYPLNDTQRIQLRLMLKTHLGAKDIRLDEVHDGNLRAGFRVFWGSLVWDASLRGRLQRLETCMRAACDQAKF